MNHQQYRKRKGSLLKYVTQRGHRDVVMVRYVRSKINSEHQEDFPIHYHEAKVVANLRPYFQGLKTQQVDFFVVPKKTWEPMPPKTPRNKALLKD